MNLSALCHTKESLSRLPETQKRVVEELAVLDPYAAKASLWRVLGKLGVKLPDDFFEQLEPGDSIEVWDSNLRLILALGSVMDMTSYPVSVLATKPWEALFDRDELVKKRVLSRFMQALQTGEPQYEVADWHEVREPLSDKSRPFEIKIKLIAPFQGPEYSGIYAISRARRLSKSNSILPQSVQALLSRILPSSQN